MPGTLHGSLNLTVNSKIWALLPEDSYQDMERNNKHEQKDCNYTLMLVFRGKTAGREDWGLWRGEPSIC